MGKLAVLDNWLESIAAFHKAVMPLGPIQNALFAQRRNYLHLALTVTPTGVESPRLPQGGVVRADYGADALVYTAGQGAETRIAIVGQTQRAVFEQMLTVLRTDELAAFMSDVDDSAGLAAGFMGKLAAGSNREFMKLDHLVDDTPIVYDAAVLRAYAAAQDAVFTGLARFRARLEGHMTPMVVWAEHLDLSTLWMVDPEMDDYKPHINIGFAPYSPGFEQPYLYAYAYPYPEDFKPQAVPGGWRWAEPGFRGYALDYDVIAGADDPVARVEAACGQVFAALNGVWG